MEAILDRVNRAVPRAFGILPKAALVVEPFPAFQEPSQPLANYEAPAEDGSRPGVYHVNLRYATTPGEKLRMEGLTFHEEFPAITSRSRSPSSGPTSTRSTATSAIQRTSKAGLSTPKRWRMDWDFFRRTRRDSVGSRTRSTKARRW